MNLYKKRISISMYNRRNINGLKSNVEKIMSLYKDKIEIINDERETLQRMGVKYTLINKEVM